MDKSLNSKTVPESLVASVTRSVFLTDNCDKQFFEYYDNTTISFLTDRCKFDDLPLICRFSIFINWFDSVGIYISIIPMIYQNERLNCFQIEINNKIIGHKTKHSRNFENRTEATLRAIEVANELFNAKVV